MCCISFGLELFCFNEKWSLICLNVILKTTEKKASMTNAIDVRRHIDLTWKTPIVDFGWQTTMYSSMAIWIMTLKQSAGQWRNTFKSDKRAKEWEIIRKKNGKRTFNSRNKSRFHYLHQLCGTLWWRSQAQSDRENHVIYVWKRGKKYIYRQWKKKHRMENKNTVIFTTEICTKNCDK